MCHANAHVRTYHALCQPPVLPFSTLCPYDSLQTSPMRPFCHNVRVRGLTPTYMFFIHCSFWFSFACYSTLLFLYIHHPFKILFSMLSMSWMDYKESYHFFSLKSSSISFFLSFLFGQFLHERLLLIFLHLCSKFIELKA